MNKLGRTAVGLLALGAILAGVYAYAIDEETKDILKKTALGISDTVQAISRRLMDEMGQVVDDDPDLARLHRELAENWKALGF